MVTYLQLLHGVLVNGVHQEQHLQRTQHVSCRLLAHKQDAAPLLSLSILSPPPTACAVHMNSPNKTSSLTKALC